MKGNDSERSIADILQSAMIVLKDSDIGVYQKIVELADEGYFEQHQTAGNLRALSDTLIAVPADGEAGNEDK